MLVVHTRIVDIVGDIIRIRVATSGSGRAGGPCLGDLARGESRATAALQTLAREAVLKIEKKAAWIYTETT